MIEYREKLEHVREYGTYRTLPHLEIEGKYVRVGGERLLNLNSNDYLGLQAMPELAKEYLSSPECRALMSSSSSRLLTGNDRAFTELEEYLAGEYGVPSALVWNSGFDANSGIIPVLVDGATLFLADRLIHASMVEGLRRSGAHFARFRHNDVAHLRRLLEKNAGSYKHIWVLVESVYSMDGDVAPLEELAALKADFPSMRLYVDEAHAVGLRGGGLGLSAELGILPQVDLLLGTLGKALGSAGAFSLQSSSLREVLISEAKSFIYTTALPPVIVGWTHFVLRRVRAMEPRREHLRSLLDRLGRRLGRRLESQIVSVIIPGDEQVLAAAGELRRAGFFARPIRKPTVAEGTERLRLSITAAMDEEEIDRIAEVLKRWM